MRCLLIALCLAAACHAELVSERWGGAGTPCTHPGTMRVDRGGQTPRLVFDLSAIPKGATIRRASLFCSTSGGGQPREPIRLVADGKPLALEPPLYRSFDATEAVRRWAAEPAANQGFAVERFDRFDAPKSYLEVRYEGTPKNLPPQVTDLRALHHDGQTFLVWKEVPDYRPRPDSVVWVDEWSETGDKLADGPGTSPTGLPRVPAIRLRDLRELQGLGLRDQPSGFQGIKPLQRVKERPAVAYRVYRHTTAITAANLHEAEFVGEAAPLCAYDEKMMKIDFKGEYLDQREIGDSLLPTYCIEGGKAVAPGEALYVYTPQKAGARFYAVTTVLAGTENAAQIGAANSLAQPVNETPAPPKPVLQFVQRDHYVAETPELWHIYWCAPPYYHEQNEPLHVTVGVPKDFKGPGPMIVNAPSMGGSFNLRGDMNVPSRTAVTLMVEQHIPWGTDLCYNEGRGTLRSFEECKVDYFSERYMLHMINWALSQWNIDRTKISGGQLHFGLRHPEIFAKMSFGAYTASYDVRWAPGSGSLATLLGPKGEVKTADGDDAWEVFFIGHWLKKHPARDIPFLICISAVGKDSGHTSEFGWQDDPRGWRALLDARQTFVASWGSEQGRAHALPPEMNERFAAMRWDITLPAFSNCSLDNNPGNGDPADGDPCGQLNGYLLWDDKDAVDAPGRWEMTLYLVADAPRETCLVDVTPRHCRNFKPKPGEKFHWTNASIADGKEVQKGEVIADQWGLVTVEKAIVGKGRNRLCVRR